MTVELAPSCLEIRTLDVKGRCTRRLNAMGLSQHPDILETDRSVNDLEVLYVGNVFSGDKVPVFDRMARHEPLQRFLKSMQQALPDDDMIVYAFEYLPYELVALSGRLRHPGEEKGTEDARFRSIREFPLSEYQKICSGRGRVDSLFQTGMAKKGR